MSTYSKRSARPLGPILLALILVATALPGAAVAQEISRPAFKALWARTDYPVQRGRGDHSWIWGPGPFSEEIWEWYVEGPGQSRPVQYFDKGRMEINDPDADPSSLWFVTSGLLTRDMIDGRVQVGNGDFVALAPAAIPVAGDPHAGFPTYADLRPYVRAQQRLDVGDYVAERLTPDGLVAAPEYAGLAAAEITHKVPANYGVPRVFWEFLTEEGVIYRNGRFTRADPLFDWLYVAGYPLADAFWVRVPVAGVPRDVMVQPFERRLLTYNPANPARFQVEMGNVGRHYYRWRYELPFADGRQALITAPERDALVASPLVVQGFERGYAFEADILVRLRTADGLLLAEAGTTVHRPDIAVPGPFSTMLTFSEPEEDTPGVVEVVVESPRDGSRQVIASQPVRIRGLAGGLGRAVALARADLSARTGVPPAELGIRIAKEVVWPDTSLGCPAPGQSYEPAANPGFQVVLEAKSGEPYDYRADEAGRLLLCKDGLPREPIRAP